MARLVTRDEVVDYVTYTSEVRPQMRRAIVEDIKPPRRLALGEHIVFLFENHATTLYQVQEMMRVEHIVRERDIVHEIDTYNELLGTGGVLGSTMLIGIDDEAERADKLRRWLPLVDHLYMVLEDGSRVGPSYDERQVGEDRLSSVQYLKWDTGGRVPTAIGSDFKDYQVETVLTPAQRAALAADLAEG